MPETTIELNPFAYVPVGIDPLAFFNRPNNIEVMRLLRSCAGDGKGHMIVSVRPASFDSRFTDHLHHLDGDCWVEFDRQRLSVIECKPNDESGGHSSAVEAVDALARHALGCGWRVWQAQRGAVGPVFQVVEGESGLFWEGHRFPLILIVLPPQDTRRAA